jgi:hypothetical protein
VLYPFKPVTLFTLYNIGLVNTHEKQGLEEQAKKKVKKEGEVMQNKENTKGIVIFI